MGKANVKKLMFFVAVILTACFLIVAGVLGIVKDGSKMQPVTNVDIRAVSGNVFYGIDGNHLINIYSPGAEKSIDATKKIESANGDNTILAAVSGNDEYVFCVTEGKSVAAFNVDAELLFVNSVTGIPYKISGSSDGTIIAVLMKSSRYSSVALFNTKLGTYKRIALDCDGIDVFIDENTNSLHVIKNDVQVVRFDFDGNMLNELIIDDIPLGAVFVNDMIYALCEDGVVRGVQTSDYSLVFSKKIGDDCTSIGFNANKNELLITDYNRKMYTVDVRTEKTNEFSAAYEIVNVYAADNGRMYFKTRMGEFYYHTDNLIIVYFLQNLMFIISLCLMGACALVAAVFAPFAFARVKVATKTFGRGVVKHRFVIAVLLPVVALVAILCYFPVLSGITYSFMDYKPGVYSRFVGLANYVAVFQNAYFWKGFLNLLIFAGTGLAKALVPPICVALFLLGLRSKRAQYFFRVTLYLPAILPGVAGLMLWTNGIYGPSGLLNNVLSMMGSQPVVWLGNKDTVVWMLTIIGFPWLGSFLIFYGALNNIPNSYIEAAKIEGSGYFNTLFKIMLPQIVPQIKYIVIMSLIGILQEFNLVYLTTAGGPGNASYVPMLEIYYQITYQNYGVASAMGVIMFLVLLCLTLFNLRSTIKNQEASI